MFTVQFSVRIAASVLVVCSCSMQMTLLFSVLASATTSMAKCVFSDTRFLILDSLLQSRISDSAAESSKDSVLQTATEVNTCSTHCPK